jgi:hypothetical protein
LLDAHGIRLRSGDRLEQLSNQQKQKTCHHQAFLKDEGLERQLAPGVKLSLGRRRTQ